MEKLNIFLPLTKADAAQRLIYGVMTAEAPDKSGEILDYASSKPLIQKWSDEIKDASGGKSLGNVRLMHGKTAVGKLVDIQFDDEARAVPICAKIVDDAAWALVEEGVLTGFSIGGGYAKRWKDGQRTRYTAEMTEVSVVDNPCLKGATFDLIKADGIVEQVALSGWAPTNEEVKARAADLAKAAGKPDAWKDQVVKARDELISEHEENLQKSNEGDAGGEAAGDAFDALEAALEKADATEEVQVTDAGPFADLTKAGPAVVAIVEAGQKADPLAKGLYDVQWLAELMSCFASLQTCMQCEADWEGDGSKLPAQAAKILADMGALLVAQAQEEVAEVVALAGEDLVIVGELDVMELAAKITDLVKADTALMEKAGARNSKSDAAHIQAAHDHTVALGATCDGKNCPQDDAEKLAAGAALEKAARNEAVMRKAATKLQEQGAELEELRKAVALIPELQAKLEALAAQPGERKGVLVFTKDGDATRLGDKSREIEKDAAGWPVDPILRRQHAIEIQRRAGYSPGGGGR